MADHDPRIETVIRNTLSRVDVTSAEARQTVYAAALRSLDRQLQSKGEEGSERARLLRDRLGATIDIIEDGYLAPMLGEDLQNSLELSDMTEQANDPKSRQQSVRSPTESARRRIGLWSVGAVIAVGSIAVLTYAVSPSWLGTSANSPFAFEASPPFPMALFGNTFEVSLNKAAGSVTVTNRSARAAESGPIPNLVLGSDLEEKLSGKTIEVVISARAPAGTAAAALEAIYYTVGVGNSGPRTFSLGPEYTDVSFTYDVPTRAAEPGEDYIGVAPASPEVNASIEVRSISIRVKPAQ